MNHSPILFLSFPNFDPDTIFAIVAVILMITFSIVFRHYLGSVTLISSNGELKIRGVYWIPKKFELIGPPNKLLRITNIRNTNFFEIILCGILQPNLSAYLAKLWGPIYIVEFQSETGMCALAIDSIDDSAIQVISQLGLSQLNIPGLFSFNPIK